jgi:hypothetical protein
MAQSNRATRPGQVECTQPGQAEFVVCDHTIERTFAWLGQNRRLSKDYERLPATSETFIHVVMSRLMIRRLAVQSGQQSMA